MTEWDYEIREVSFADLAPLATQAKRDKNITFKDTSKSQWFGLYVGNELAAFAGVYSMRNDFEVGRLKQAFTEPSWRGQGFGTALVDFRIGWLEGRGCKEMHTISVRHAFWLSRGFQFEGPTNFFVKYL